MRTNLSDVFTTAERAALKPKIVARNTFRYTRADGASVYRLHRTDVLTVNPDGSEVMDSGGWRTLTTKDRLQTYSRYRLYQHKGEWFVTDPATRETVPYYDGIRLPDAFKPQGQAKAAAALEERTSKDKAIKAFVAKLKPGKVPTPNSGDCWSCAMRGAPGPLTDAAREIGVSEQEAAKFGLTMGDHGGDVSHLWEHVKEGYMHGSLIVNALVAAGYTHPAIFFSMGDVKTMRRALLKYLRARLLR